MILFYVQNVFTKEWTRVADSVYYWHLLKMDTNPEYAEQTFRLAKHLI